LTVVVIGGGFSGLLTALHLLESDADLMVRLVERAERFGPGRAYSAANPDHLLNVRAANMSAFPDRPDHFLSWLRAHDLGGDEFVSRGCYGDYLQALLREALGPDGHPGRLLLEQDEAIDVRVAGRGLEVHLAVGRQIEADAVVFATGLSPPPTPPGAAGLGHAYVADPWRLEPDDAPTGDVLLIGSGLTMVDVALSLDRPDRRLTAISRRGLMPLEHGPAPPAPLPAGALDTPRAASRALRIHAKGVGWRSAVDSIRPLTPAIWGSWRRAERDRFLRHARPWWDIHRHRMAPRVAARIQDMVAAGRLQVIAGRILAMAGQPAGVEVTYRRRAAPPETHAFAAAVNCAGLSGDIAQAPLYRALIARRAARPDVHGLGLDVDAYMRVLGSDGPPVKGLYAVGPLVRGARWESVAVPDLRHLTWELARRIAGDLAR
jgi:uncharacterized NAD(P)/FAD-binding protein YdhS